MLSKDIMSGVNATAIVKFRNFTPFKVQPGATWNKKRKKVTMVKKGRLKKKANWSF